MCLKGTCVCVCGWGLALTGSEMMNSVVLGFTINGNNFTPYIVYLFELNIIECSILNGNCEILCDCPSLIIISSCS